ncbi:hypothetical protein JCM10908_000782 [Rhodotorula pacifica]|uniref:uncharacterized protein n=1 Tax=Rhodotorula pacifica TaxID=1495444 RepID=UPI003171F597
MAIARTPAHSAARYHYARLLCTPVLLAGMDPTAPTATMDRATFLQLVSRVLQDLYGTMGGPIGLSEIDVIAIEGVTSSSNASGDGGSRASEVVIRFPAGATHAILTALPLARSSPFRLTVLRHSSDLSRLAGVAGHGQRGYREWVQVLKNEAATAGATEQNQVEMQQG